MLQVPRKVFDTFLEPVVDDPGKFLHGDPGVLSDVAEGRLSSEDGSDELVAEYGFGLECKVGEDLFGE